MKRRAFLESVAALAVAPAIAKTPIESRHFHTIICDDISADKMVAEHQKILNRFLWWPESKHDDIPCMRGLDVLEEIVDA